MKKILLVVGGKVWILGVILVVGGIFMYVVFRRGGIDIESSRYVLSAIVQALAALLAIIFAGVAIIWMQEGIALSEIKQWKYVIEGRIFQYSEQPNEPSRLWRAFKELKLLLLKDKKSNGNDWSKYKPGILSMAKLILLHKEYEPQLYLTNSNIDYEGEIKETVKEFLSGTCFEKFKEDAEGLLKPSKLEAFFYEVRNVVKTIHRFKELDHGFNPHINFLNRLELNVEDASRLWKNVHRSRHVRGWKFKLFATLSLVTIAFGIGSLALLTNGGCPSQTACNFHLTWVTLALAFVTVAATFFYLYDVVTIGKEA